MGIKDSGEKREFETGSHRDMAVGKGRMDLLPADIVADLLEEANRGKYSLEQIDNYMQEALFDAFCYLADEDMDALKSAAVFATCACAENEEIVEGYKPLKANDDITKKLATGLVIVSKHYEEGARKYGENNWKLGQPLNVLMDSGIRHTCKAIAGIDDEPHFRAAAWNFLCALWMLENKPEMNNLK